MTREEVDILNDLWRFSVSDRYTDKEIRKAIDKAIEALKQERPHGECKTCKHFVRGGLDGKTCVCEHPDILLDDHFDYACIMMNENDFCSRYEKEEGEQK